MRKKFGLILAAILLFLLGGCVDYDVGIKFDTQHQGQIVQKIALGKQLTTLNQFQADELLNSVESRVKQLQGKTQRISEREIKVVIPFNNGQDLISKFNQFFTPKFETSTVDAIGLLQLNPEISLQESNLLLFQREKLHLIVDLTSLGVFSNEGDLIVSSGSLVNLDFTLNTPLGATSVKKMTYLKPEVTENSRQLLWHLKPGEVNEIEIVFWVPSSLGIGAVIITIIVIIGFYFKYKRFPWILETA